VWVDAVSMKVGEAGRVCNTAVLVATAVNADGYRELVGLDIGSAEDGASWTAFLRGLVARGLAGVKLVVSDAHGGLKGAIAAVLEGASWQRCRTHSRAQPAGHGGPARPPDGRLAGQNDLRPGAP
jgi:transposase-like protein